MTKNDFLNILSDAVQFHEGWNVGSVSSKNNNPGNLRFVGQKGATAGLNGFCRFEDFYAGKEAQLRDLGLKLERYDTIRDIISVYAPPSENNTEAYIKNVILFFSWRGINITPETSLKLFISTVTPPTILIAINSLFNPTDWHSLQQSLTLLNSWIKNYSISTRYINVDLSNDIIQENTIISQSTSILDGDKVSNILAPINEGQIFNILIYDGTIMQGHPTPAGGCEYQGLKFNKLSSVSSVLYSGSMFTESTSRVLFHEFIHEFLNIENQTDILHQYLQDHGGYMNNLLSDLLAVFNGVIINNPPAVKQLQKVELSLLQQLVELLKRWLNLKQ